MLDLALPVFNFNLGYAQKLVADVADDQMCAQPVEGRVMNHAAFTIGHLAWATDLALGMLGQTPAGAAEWKELFGMGAKPLADRSKYPAKAALLKALEEAHVRLAAAVAKASPEALAQPAPERMRGRFPTMGHTLLALMTSHEASHLGQLSAWRRAMGLPSVF
jgi:uncharacterized damage-inducible protein DinB